MTSHSSSGQLHVAEVARRLGKSRRTITLWCVSGRIPGATLYGGRVWLIPEESLPLIDLPPRPGRPRMLPHEKKGRKKKRDGPLFYIK